MIFEEYSEYYHEISREEHMDDDIESLKFDQMEINTLSSLYTIRRNKDDTCLAFTFNNNYVCDVYDHYNYYLYKLPDEWYIVNMRTIKKVSSVDLYIAKFYKCDQFEGLIKCLEDILIYNS